MLQSASFFGKRARASTRVTNSRSGVRAAARNQKDFLINVFGCGHAKQLHAWERELLQKARMGFDSCYEFS